MSKQMPAMQGRPKIHSFKLLGRLLSYLFHYYKVRLIAVFICIMITAAAGISSSVFLSLVIKYVITPLIQGTPWAEVSTSLFYIIGGMGLMYVIALCASVFYNQTMAVVTQGFLKHVRTDMFNRMQSLPIRYFDTHTHGDIMSTYTNDTDALRQLISMSIPQVYYSIVAALVLFVIMLLYSLWLMFVVFVGVAIMAAVAKYVGSRSAKYFIRQQAVIGKTEGYIEEMMGGQKVIKVFCHEERAKEDFDKINDELCDASDKANAYGNILMPAVMNIGHFAFVLVAIVAGLLVLFKVQNLSVMGWEALSGAVIASFLNMSRQFSLNIGQVSMQINSVVMGLAGAGRIFELLDEQPETDEGYVTLVNAKIDENGNITECAERTGKWAWRHPHQADGSVTYTELKGDIQLYDVDFGYVPEKIVLHNVSIYAKPGQKIAFVGATGAGKTTITNLLNRFYDIADGKIRYDGININKIKKADLRRSLGIVLQDTNLFTGTIMENIRYGKLDATDEECIAAAKLANAHDFITRLPEGYNTVLRHEASNLSQGQRQLISIARAAVADPPVMILDEATSSIDTRTEALVQKGMDALMQGRTVFVIAHRLSTIRNSDAIMVLDHGRIIERGSHDQLIAQKGVYYQLYTGAFELE
ncbi:MAG TPA: ABC transporter ATP-binding protein/permease [Candidatus Borkfalkia faecipullorum]|uniref:ABC transporter ATP-binding protein/permease n=1 Tax=Candidatus Borkfalkia faecipullorum TaxID=2838510 RepID=A0A9D1V6U3_9FIRM|nr:ABC transporter ATP-binding protein/permease [Candidatus Borkfalkia faecipullorum]